MPRPYAQPPPEAASPYKLEQPAQPPPHGDASGGAPLSIVAPERTTLQPPPTQPPSAAPPSHLASKRRAHTSAPATADGAAAMGWRVHQLSTDGHYRYTSPEGQRMHSKTEALALRSKEDLKKSARQRARTDRD